MNQTSLKKVEIPFVLKRVKWLSFLCSVNLKGVIQIYTGYFTFISFFGLQIK